MRSTRLARKTIPLTILSVLGPMIATAWLLGAGDDERLRSRSPNDSRAATAPIPRHAGSPEGVTLLPPGVAGLPANTGLTVVATTPPGSPTSSASMPRPSASRPSAPRVPLEQILPRATVKAPATAAEVQQTVAQRTASPGDRYVALRRLAEVAPEAAVVEAEALVLAAQDDPNGRFLAVNALGVLAGTPAGRVALARCAERAPQAAMRQSARTLLLHGGG